MTIEPAICARYGETGFGMVGSTFGSASESVMAMVSFNGAVFPPAGA